MNEFANESAEVFNSDQKKKQHPVILALKGAGILIIVVICGLLLFSFLNSCDHSLVDKVLMNDEFMQQHQSADVPVEVQKYGMNSSWVAIREGRLLEFNNLYYLPSLSQLQVSVKYNKDMPNPLNQDTPLEFKLVDENGNEYTDYWYEKAEKGKFVFLRVCFEGIELEKDELDENGQKKRHTYKIVADLKDEKGNSFEKDGYGFPYECEIYNGKNIYKLVDYKVEE